MPFLNYNPDANWEDLHTHLRDHLQEEVRLTRELLSNMHQEELSLILCDQGTLNQVLAQQFHLFERLSILRLNRYKITLGIEKMVVEKKKTPSVDELLPPAEEISTEILSLTDQLVCLTEHMSKKYGQNQNLSRRCDSPAHFQLVLQPRPKKKASVATYNLNRYTNMS